MLGHDVEYSNKLDDALLIATAKKEHRVLLTHDLELYQQAVAKGVEAFYVEGKTEPERLAQVAHRFHVNFEIDMTTSRCPKCNTRVKPVSKDKIADKVEKSTLANYNEFWECPKCGQVYWQGAHWIKIEKTLDQSKKILEEIASSKKE